MDIPHLFIHQLMEIWIVSTFLAFMNNAANEHSPSGLCVDVGFFLLVLGKYLEVESLGYVHASVCAIPSWGMLEARSLLSPPQVTVFSFLCCDDRLLLTTTSVSASGQLQCWPSLVATKIEVSSNTPGHEFFLHFALNLFCPLHQGGRSSSQPAPLWRTTVPPNLGGCGGRYVWGRRIGKLLWAKMPDAHGFYSKVQ